MTAVGVTGHSNLTAATYELVRDALSKVLADYGDESLIGITCLARGADQIFAQVVLDLGGSIEAVIPAKDYDQIPDPESRRRYSGLLAQAVAVREMPFETSGSEAYLAASQELIRRSDVLIAVWDGTPADGRGGTADAVAYAQSCGRKVTVVWPLGARRS